MTAPLPEETVQPEETVDEPVPAQEFLEFVGTPPYGTEFYSGEFGTHVVTAKQLKDAYDVDLGKKEVVWRKDKNGRMLVSTEGLTPEAVEALANDQMFKVVSK